MRSRNRRSGQAFVESGLIMLIFVPILIGIMDFGQFLFYQQGVVERVRAAARWGSVTDPTNATAITNVLLYNQSATPPAGTAAAIALQRGCAPHDVPIGELQWLLREQGAFLG